MPRFISIIIPAHNEADLISLTIDAARSAAEALGGATRYEVIVACDACTDGTAAIAAARGAIVTEFDRRQIAASRNAGAGAARRDSPAHEHLLVFVDADTRINRDTLRQAVRSVQRGAAGGGAPMEFDGEIPAWARVVLPLFNGAFRLFRLTGGAFFFIRRDHFEAVGGWDESVFAGEEINLAKTLKLRGRFDVVRTPVLTSGRKLRTYSGRELLAMWLRFAGRGRTVLESREMLGLWYDPRRKDPHEPARIDQQVPSLRAGDT